MRAIFHETPRQGDRRSRSCNSGDCPGIAVRAFHDRGVQLDLALFGEDASSARIEAGIFLEQAGGGFHGVDRAPAVGEDGRAFRQSTESSGYGLGAIGPGIGVGLIFASVIQGTARQPEARGAMMGTAWIGFAVTEALAIIGIALAFVFG